MKVLQINQVYKFGSTGRIVSDLKLKAESNDIKMYVAYGYYTKVNNVGHEDDALCLQPHVLRRKLNILRTRLFDRHGFYNEHETNKLLRWIDEIKPDIIHLHNIHSHYVHVARLFEYIKKSNIPVVWTLHDCWSFTGHCAHFDYVKCEKWKTQCHHCPIIHNYPPTWFIDRSERTYKDKKNAFTGVDNMTIVSPSEWLIGLTKFSFLKEYPSAVINNGIDINVFKPICNNSIKAKLGIANKKMYLIILPVFEKSKGAHYIVPLSEMLSNNEALVVVGLSSSQCKKISSEKCICINRTESIHELAEYYSAADVYLNLTLEDTFPTTNLEAVACGTPVVTFATGGSVEVVKSGENLKRESDDTIVTPIGTVVPHGNINLLLEHARIIADKGKNVYADACRKKAEMRYDRDKQYQKYIDLYKSILSE